MLLEALLEVTPEIQIEEARAKELLSLIVKMLIDRPKGNTPLTLENDGGGAWAWCSSLPDLNKCFAHLPRVGNSNAILWRLPQRNDAKIVTASKREVREVLIDPFGLFASEASNEKLVLTRQMLVDLSEQKRIDRTSAFVRMLSGYVPVKRLILSVTEKSSQELELIFQGRDPQALVNEREFDRDIRTLLNALDLEFDEDDMIVLLDACAGRIGLLLLVLNSVAQHLADDPPSNRVFDVVGTCAMPVVDRKIEEVVSTYLNGEFGKDIDVERRKLEVIDEIFDLILDEHKRPWLNRPELATMLTQFADNSLRLNDSKEALGCIDRMVVLGFLRPSAGIESSNEPVYRRNRNRVYDALLRASN